MPTVQLHDRALLEIGGSDAQVFLQNLITTDLDALDLEDLEQDADEKPAPTFPLPATGASEAKPGALLSPQGKILFDFLISKLPDGAYRLDCPAGAADDFIRRLTLYKLRADVKIIKQDQPLVWVSWGDDSDSSHSESTTNKDPATRLRDARFPESANVSRLYGAIRPSDEARVEEWHAFRASFGIAESGVDYVLGDAFPHDVLLDQTGGIGFRKGCYIGQEVVSRMQHRGTARRRALIVNGDKALPEPGTDIMANGRTIGTLGTTSDHSGLAIVRIDRAKDAMDAQTPIVAGETTVTLSIPAWAGFEFPGDKAPSEAD